MLWIYQIIIVILTSFHLFPIEFRVLPSVNTKMIMAVLGVVLFLLNSILKKENILLRKVIYVALCAFLVSFIGIISILYNETNDFTYASYFVSFLVWFSSAYFVVGCLRIVHGCASVNLVSKYLIAVAIIQCLLAVLIDLVPFVKDVVNSYVVGFASMYSAGEGLEKAGRLYGIGAALDVAGTRFCVILSIIGIMIYEAYQLNNKKQTILYLTLFVILLVIGSMISRTTGIGLVFICLYMIFMFRNSKTNIGLYGIVIISMVSLITVVLILFNTNTFFNEYLRFAFEGLFNYLETGQWRLSSTDTLQGMYVFPESLKTWIIGDGYFNEPYYYDPYYVGIAKNYGLFYMGTDVGYIRFIYYFGVSGLLAFIMYFIMNTYHCVSDFPKKKWIFYAILMMNFIVWFKVATDVFCIFALFLCISKEENDNSEQQNVLTA